MPEERIYLFDERFAEAYLHKKHNVLGRTLQPLSYWHSLQLQWINSKLLLGGASRWDVYLATKICQSQYPHRAKLPKSKRSNLWNLIWSIWYGWRDEKKAILGFLEYWNDYNSCPKFWGKGSETSKTRLAEACEQLAKITGDPADEENAKTWKAVSQSANASDDQMIDESLEAVSFYTRKACRPVSEAWNMPIGELHWMCVAFNKVDGHKVEIWTPLDDIRFEQHKISRQKKIIELAKALQENDTSISDEKALAQAGVNYWTRVVTNVDAGTK